MGEQMKFWSTLNDKINESGDSPVKPQKPTGKHWHTFSLGKSGVYQYAGRVSEDVLSFVFVESPSV